MELGETRSNDDQNGGEAEQCCNPAASRYPLAQEQGGQYDHDHRIEEDDGNCVGQRDVLDSAEEAAGGGQQVQAPSDL